MELLIELMILFWGLMMLKVALIFADKPLKYSVLPLIVAMLLLFVVHPSGA